MYEVQINISPERSESSAFLYRPSSPADVWRKVPLEIPESDDDDSDVGCDPKQSFSSFRSACESIGVVSLLLLGALVGYGATELRRRDGGAARKPPNQQAEKDPIDPLFAADPKIRPPERDESAYAQPLPELSSLIDADAQAVRPDADVSWLLDFAVVGNAKSGTTFLKNYLGRHDEIYADPHETCKMSNNRTDSVVKFFHDRLGEVGATVRADHTEDGRRIKTGLKCPKEIGTQDGLGNYAKYFPRTDFIVTLRHPVTWFQSFYNYRSYGGHPRKMPPPFELIGACQDNGSPYTCPHTCGHIRTENVCTDRARYHHQLSRFGKTPMTSEEERRLLSPGDLGVVPTKARIFLTELGQFIPENAASERVAEDLSAFLGLEKQLPSIEEVGGHKRSYPDEERRENFIDICDEEHAEVRELLVDIGREAYVWIKDYFLQSPDVVVSSRELFLELIEKWGHDPCLERTSP